MGVLFTGLQIGKDGKGGIGIVNGLVVTTPHRKQRTVIGGYLVVYKVIGTAQVGIDQILAPHVKEYPGVATRVVL
jgi:hypothetical protein